MTIQRSSRLCRTRRLRSKLEITPLIDMMFLLVIFFTVTSAYSTSTSYLELELPRGGEVKPSQVTAVKIAILNDGRVLLNDSESSPESIYQQLRMLNAAGGEVSCEIFADQSISYGSVIEIMDRVTAAGVYNVSLAAMPPVPQGD